MAVDNDIYIFAYNFANVGMKPDCNGSELVVLPGLPKKFKQNPNIFMNMSLLKILLKSSMELFKVLLIMNNVNIPIL